MPDFFYAKAGPGRANLDRNGDPIPKEQAMPDSVIRSVNILRDMDGPCSRNSTVDMQFVESVTSKDRQGRDLPGGQTCLHLKNGAFLVVAGFPWDFDPKQAPPKRKRGRQ